MIPTRSEGKKKRQIVSAITELIILENEPVVQDTAFTKIVQSDFV